MWIGLDISSSMLGQSVNDAFCTYLQLCSSRHRRHLTVRSKEFLCFPLQPGEKVGAVGSIFLNF